MREKLLAVLLILASILAVTALTRNNPSEPVIQKFVDPDWKNWTVKRLELAQDPGTGGWSGVHFTITPSIYATYHGTLALELLNLTPKDPQKTVEFLRDYETKVYAGQNSRSNVDVLDSYYLLVLFDKFNLTPQYGRTLEHLIIKDMEESEPSIIHAKSLILLNSTLARNVSMSLWLSLEPEHSLEFVWSFLQYRELLLESGYSINEIPNYTKMHNLALAVFNNASRELDDPGFYDAYILAHFIKEENIQNETLKKHLLEAIFKYKCPDGSYSDMVGEERGHIDTTHWAVEAITYLGGKVGEDTVCYLRSRESPLGGFIKIPNFIVPNPVDTGFSVIVLRYLNSTVPKEEKVKEYLLTRLSTEDEPPVMWVEYRALKELGVPREELRGAAEPRIREFIASTNLSEIYHNHYLLRDIYYLLLTSNELGIKIDPQWNGTVKSLVLSLRDDDGGFGSRITSVETIRLETTLYSVLVLNELGYGYRDEKTVEFIKSQRDGALWRFLPTTRYALLALNSLGVKIDRKEEMINALELAKCPYGFFSYGSCKNPESGDIMATFQVLEILKLIDEN